MSKREAFLALALRQEGAPYVWGSDGILCRLGSEMVRCFDCSGLVCYCLHVVGGPDWRSSHTADRMFRELPPTSTPRPGDLSFYGRPDENGKLVATHVMLWVGDNTGRVFGACGGDRFTKTSALALARGASVMFKSRVDYRNNRANGKSDWLGFRTLTPLDQE